MDEGFFLVDRKIFKKLWRDVVTYRLFFWILGKAAFARTEIEGVEIRRGQYLRSYRNLQDDLEYKEGKGLKRYSLATIVRAVDKLVKEERIKIQSTDYGTLFTVVNYEEYQGLQTSSKNDSETVNEHQLNEVRTRSERGPNKNNNATTQQKRESMSENEFSDAPPPEKKNSERKFPDSPGGRMAEYLFHRLRDLGKTEAVLNEKWRRVSIQKANKFLKESGVSEARMKEAIDWFANHEGERFSWRANLSRMSHVTENWSQFESAQAEKVLKRPAGYAFAEAWRLGKSFRYKPTGKIVPAADVVPWNYLSSSEEPVNPNAFARADDTSKIGYLKDFEIIEGES